MFVRWRTVDYIGLVSFCCIVYFIAAWHHSRRNTCNPPWFWRSFINLNLKWLFKFSCRIISSRPTHHIQALWWYCCLKSSWNAASLSGLDEVYLAQARLIYIYTFCVRTYQFCVLYSLGTNNFVTRIHHFNG